MNHFQGFDSNWQVPTGNWPSNWTARQHGSGYGEITYMGQYVRHSGLHGGYHTRHGSGDHRSPPVSTVEYRSSRSSERRHDGTSYPDRRDGRHRGQRGSSPRRRVDDGPRYDPNRPNSYPVGISKGRSDGSGERRRHMSLPTEFKRNRETRSVH